MERSPGCTFKLKSKVQYCVYIILPLWKREKGGSQEYLFTFSYIYMQIHWKNTQESGNWWDSGGRERGKRVNRVRVEERLLSVFFFFNIKAHNHIIYSIIKVKKKCVCVCIQKGCHNQLHVACCESKFMFWKYRFQSPIKEDSHLVSL